MTARMRYVVHPIVPGQHGASVHVEPEAPRGVVAPRTWIRDFDTRYMADEYVRETFRQHGEPLTWAPGTEPFEEVSGWLEPVA